MLRVSLDEGYVYDLLSIAAVKVAKQPANQTNLANHRRLEREIIAQVGTDLYVEILGSPEYAALYKTNHLLFDLIDWIKDPRRPADSCYDLDVDELNLRRKHNKAALQARWFPLSPFTETKIGYDKP